MWQWTGGIQKRVCRYLLQRYLGQYLLEKISLDQLTVDLYNGTGEVTDVDLDCLALNGLAEQHNLPIEFIEGHLEKISASVPWSTIMQESCEIQITGLHITIQPRKRVDNGNGSSMLDSMFTSMASSMQLAEECLKTGEEIKDDSEDENSNQDGLSGLEHCAQTIDAVLSRVQMSFYDTTLRVENYHQGGVIGVALQFDIKKWEYSDEASQEVRDESNNKVFDSAFTYKKINLEGVTCRSDIFSAKAYQTEENDMTSSQTDEVVPDDTVLIARFAGSHDIRLKVKTDDSIGGPQISIDCNFGSLIALLSPIQAHICYKILDELLNPTASRHDGVNKRMCEEKPMSGFDFRRVEEELMKTQVPGAMGLPCNLIQQKGWSYANYDDNEDEFLPLNPKSEMFSSTFSNFMNASTTSITSTTQQCMTESTTSAIKSNSYAYMSTNEKTKFSISFASVAVILLHDDIMTLSLSEVVLPATLKEMKDCSRKFFETLRLFGVRVKGKKDVEAIREKLNAACDRSHHRIIAAPIKIEGLLKATNNSSETEGHITLGYCEVIESLKNVESMPGTPNPECIEVITFPRNFDHGSNVSIKIEFKTANEKDRALMRSKTAFRFFMQECNCEVDISLIDRMNSLINSPLHYYLDPKSSSLYNKQPYQVAKTFSTLKIKVDCNKFSLNFRFPIPDLRPVDDSNRVPYWLRNLRNDSIVVQMNELDFLTIIDSNSASLKFDIKSHEVRLYYKENPSDDPILFATGLADDPEIDLGSIKTKGLDWPRIVVTLYPEKSADEYKEVESSLSDEGDSIVMGMLKRKKEKGPSPFSSKRVVHETLNSQDDSNEDATESVTPGDRSEMNDFVELVTKNTLLNVDIFVRFVDLTLPSKHFFEEIYNRIGNDLLLWESSRLASEDKSSPGKIHVTQNSFSACKSSNELDCDSESEEEITAFYTPGLYSLGQSQNDRGESIKKITRGQSDITFNLTVIKGIGSLYTPFQNHSGQIVPGQKGHMTLKIENGSLFFVSSFEGNPNLGYLCLTSHKAEMMHADLVKNDGTHEQVSTIYSSDDGVLDNINRDSGSFETKDMLSVAIRIEKDPLKRVKVFKVAAGIQDGTLNHIVFLPNRSWFAQITEFFDVTDTPIIGYTPSAVLTELHLHLWNCSVDYRPKNLPLRCILTMDLFSISSNIAAQTSSSVIRFLAEEASFYLTTKLDSTDLQNDYVCVMDLDFFELSLRLCNNRHHSAPRTDLAASSNVLNIRTCSDSFKALLELLTYYNNEGDLLDPKEQCYKFDDQAPYSPIKESSSEPALIATEEISERDRRMSESQTEHVNDLVADAMKDSSLNRAFKHSVPENYNGKHRNMYDLHFTAANDADLFGHYSSQDHGESSTTTPLPDEPIMQTSNGLAVDIQFSDEDEEEFCILENDPGVGIIPKSGEPQARVLCDEPIRLIENYFTPPAGKMDILKAPKHYPKPVTKYALKELTVVWHIHGGEDFASTKKSTLKTDDIGSSETLYKDAWKEQVSFNEQSEVDFAVDALNSGVLFSKNKTFESAWEAYDSPKSQRKEASDNFTMWKHQGGKGRRHDVKVELHLTKIKFIHEVYPESTEQSSRQVLVINNVEILDKLRTSQFNKMMCLYTSPSRPKQTHANMVMIKAVHIRPDPQLSAEECCLKISILPIRLYIDQDALAFAYQFFSDLAVRPDNEDDDSTSGRFTNPPSHTPSIESLPVMTVNNVADVDGLCNPDQEEGSNLLMFTEEQFGNDDNVSLSSKDPSVESGRLLNPVYFRQVIFSPETPIRLDYMGKRVDMTHGPLAGLLMGLAQLNCSEIRLERISYCHGILGLDRLAAFLISHWAADIKKNQLPSLLGGVGPMHSFVQLFQGVRDLFWLPIEQYQKDGRIAKGLQRGVNAFSTSTAMAALELTNKLIQTIQGAAEFTYDMVSPGPSVQQKRRQSSSKRKRYTQPGDIREGMTNAYNVVREGLGDTAHAIVKVASKEHEQKGISGAVGGVLRQIPPTVVRPIILVAEATSNVLDGFRSQLEPEFKKENEEKWKET